MLAGGLTVMDVSKDHEQTGDCCTLGHLTHCTVGHYGDTQPARNATENSG